MFVALGGCKCVEFDIPKILKLILFQLMQEVMMVVPVNREIQNQQLTPTLDNSNKSVVIHLPKQLFINTDLIFLLIRWISRNETLLGLISFIAIGWLYWLNLTNSNHKIAPSFTVKTKYCSSIVVLNTFRLYYKCE